MKTRVILVAMVLMGYSAAFSQSEYDDVYFSRKDRNRQQAIEPKALKTVDKTSDDYPILAKAHRKEVGYTGRTINPDYQSKYSTGTDVSSYFVPDYQPRVTNNGFNSAYAYNNCYSCYSGWGMRNRIGFGMGMGMYSPFYSGWGYSPYGYNGYGYGSMYDPYGYYGYNSWGNPYSSWGYPSYYGSGWGMGYGYGYGSGMFGGWFSNSYYSRPVVVSNPEPHTYGKRSSRNSGIVNEGATGRNSQIASGGQTTGSSRGGRVASTNSGNTSGSRYYQRGWRQDPTVNPAATNTGGSRSGSGWVGSGSNSSRTSTWGSSNSNRNSGWGNSNWNNSNSTFGGGSRSTFGTGGGSIGGGSFGGGSRSTGGGGGHSGGGSRGRN